MSNYNCINSMGSDSTSYLDLWGSLNTFYSIANGVIDSMQESPNSGRQLGLYLAMNMTQGYGNQDIIEASSNQFGLYFLQGVGTVFCLAILCIAVFFTCCLRCCKRCSRKSDSQPLSRFEQFIALSVQLIVYVICFAFILTGTIIYGVSVNNFISSINSDNTYIPYRQYFVNNTARQGTDQLQCAYDGMIRTLSALPQQTSSEPQNLVNIWRSSAGLTVSFGVDTPDILSDLIPQAVTYGEIVKTNLTTLMAHPSFINNAQAQNELQNMINQISTANGRMSNILPILPQLRNETVRVLAKSNDTEQYLLQTITNYDSNLLLRMSQSDQFVLTTLNSISSAGYQSARWSNQLWTTIATKTNNAYTWGGLDPIKSTAIAAIALPASIIMLFCVICILVCIFKILAVFLPTVEGKVDVRRHGRHGANFIRGGFYFSIWVGIVPFMVATALVWYSQLYAGTCFNLYNENGRGKFYHSVNYEDMTAISYNGHIRKTSYNQFLVQAEFPNPTMYSILSSQNPLIGANDIPKYINAAGTKSDVDSLIKNTDLEGGFDAQLAASFSNSDLTLNISTAYFLSTFANGFLPYCTSLDWNATWTVKQELTQYTLFYLTGVQSFADDEADSTSKASADSQTQTVNLMTHETTQFYVNYFGAYVGTASANLLNALNSNIYAAFPVYVNYMKSGDMLCSYVRSPLNGLWAAAGMIGIFWIPAAICLFFTSSYLYKTHKRTPATVVHAQMTQQVTQPTVVTPVVTNTVQSVFVASPPPTTVATAPTVVMATPVVTSTTTPALYPVIDSDSLAIIEEL